MINSVYRCYLKKISAVTLKIFRTQLQDDTIDCYRMACPITEVELFYRERLQKKKKSLVLMESIPYLQWGRAGWVSDSSSSSAQMLDHAIEEILNLHLFQGNWNCSVHLIGMTKWFGVLDRRIFFFFRVKMNLCDRHPFTKYFHLVLQFPYLIHHKITIQHIR